MNANISKNRLSTGVGIAVGMISLLFGALILASLLSSPGFNLFENILPSAVGTVLVGIGIAIIVLSS